MPTPNTPNPTPAPARRPQRIAIIVLSVLLVIGALAGYQAYNLLHPKAGTPTDTVNDTVDTVDGESEEQVVVNTPGTTLGEVTWTAAKELPLVKLFTTGTPVPVSNYTEYSYTPDASAKMWQLGTVNSGQFKGATIIRYTYRDEGPVAYDTYLYLLQQGGKYTLLKKNSNQIYTYDGGPQLNTSLVTVDESYELPDLRYPDQLTGPKPGQTLVRVDGVNAVFSTNGLKKVFTDKTYGDVYGTNLAPSGVGLDFNSNAAVDAYNSGTVFSTRNGFYLKAPDGTVRVYKLRPDIISGELDASFNSGTIEIDWTAGPKTSAVYNLSRFTGCGAANYINAVSPSEVSLTKDLQRTGIAANGAAIYEWKDSQAERLKSYYSTTSVYDPETGTSQQPNYFDFIDSHPVIYWVDPFDRLIELTNAVYTPLAECGKPVIYLYPTERSDVDVHLRPLGGFTYTEPTYLDGWRVTAEPDGRLTERRTGKTYPYLFWEGRGDIYTEPTKGFVVAQADVHSFLVEKLAAQGLNAQETADFLEFWEPRMQGSPYYQVSFLGNRSMDELAPLRITPRPDTVIRILMDFKPLPAPVAIEPQVLHAPVRRGFTVVEWGGVIR